MARSIPLFTSEMKYEDVEKTLVRSTNESLKAQALYAVENARLDLLQLVASRSSMALRKEMRSSLVDSAQEFGVRYVSSVLDVLGFSLKQLQWWTLLNMFQFSVSELKIANELGAGRTIKFWKGAIIEELRTRIAEYDVDEDDEMVRVLKYIQANF